MMRAIAAVLALALPASLARAVTTAPARTAAKATAGKASAGQAASPQRNAGAPKAKKALAPPRSDARDEVPTPGDDDLDRGRIVRLQEALSGLVGQPPLSRARVGMRVVGAADGRLFFARRPGALMDPASNQKVLATASAMIRLGPDWRYRTEAEGPAPDALGVVLGDLVLRGSGDPTLRAPDLEAMAAHLVRGGVRRIEGSVVGDPRRLGADVADDGLRPALEADRGLVTVRVRPARSVGAAPEVSARPWWDTFLIRNRAVTRSGRRSRLVFALSIAGGRLVLDVAGTIGMAHKGLVVRRRVPESALHAAALFTAALTDAGIAVAGPPRIGGLADRRADLLAVHRSPPLSVVCRRVNKDSDNELSERVLETVGAEVMGGPAAPGKGLRVLREVLGDLGLRSGSYLPTNGSGLGHANRITAGAMANLLRALYLDPRVGPEMMQSLSVGGVDGTTRNRFRNSPSAKRVRAKTGTLRGVSCLSGVVGDGGDAVVFSILVEGFRRRALNPVRLAQVAAVNAMMRYLREAGGAVSDLPIEAEGAGVDYESGEESAEGEAREQAQPQRPGESEIQDADPGELDRLLELDRQRAP